MESEAKIWCTKCTTFRSINDFQQNANSKFSKLCIRHPSKKRVLDVFDSWDSFIKEICIWNKPNQTKVINTKYMFNLDQLPVSFGSKLLAKDDGASNREPLNKAMKQLSEIIWKKGGFRFAHWKTRTNAGLVYEYYCSQDRAHEETSISEGKRDIQRMERFLCKSKLIIQPSLEDRTLGLMLFHIHHTPYVNIQLSTNTLEFIQERVLTSTPSEIYRDLLAANVLGSQLATQSQVYYQWQQANSNIWRRDSDPFISASRLLLEAGYQYRVYTSGNMRGLAVYIQDIINNLASDTKELAMDATFGTNNSGMDLFAVLAELDGMGIPLAYFFVETLPLDDGNRRANPGATTHILVQFIHYLKDFGFNPTFFGTDKDHSEISAVKITQEKYDPAEAQTLVSDLEICWGSLPTRHPNGAHRYENCQCLSRGKRFDDKGRLEPSSPAERDIVLNIICCHYNTYPLIPDRNGTYRTAKDIHQESATEMYKWCKARDYFRLWAYLYINWYRPRQWELWVRSTNEKEIPILKTTMIVEAHWRKIKYDYLHRFNRPRIDLVLWIILSRIIPEAVNQMKFIQKQDFRKVIASWRKAFKRNWKVLTNNEIKSESLQKYYTDPVKWSCACNTFLISKFLICKYIIHCYKSPEDPFKFFRDIKKQKTIPFWVNKQLILLPEYAKDLNTAIITHMSESEDEELVDSESELEDEETVSSNSLFAEEDQRSQIDILISDFEKVMKFVKDTYYKQKALDNTKFIEKVIAGNTQNQILAEEIKRLKNQRTMPLTWTRNKHPATMYYR